MSSKIITACFSLFLSLNCFAAEERSGQQLFQDFGCMYCHGITGHRGATAGRHLAPTAHTIESFSLLVRFPANNMPAYESALLSNEQLGSIFEYINKLEEPPALEDIDSLSAMRDAILQPED